MEPPVSCLWFGTRKIAKLSGGFLSFLCRTHVNKGANDGISKDIGAPFYLINANRERAIYQPLWEAFNAYREQATKQTLEDLK